jgi:hypothetical protein
MRDRKRIRSSFYFLIHYRQEKKTQSHEIALALFMCVCVSVVCVCVYDRLKNHLILSLKYLCV